MIKTNKARIALGGIRLLNGTLGLLAPDVLIRRIDPGHKDNPAAVYAFRLFGIRTVLLGGELLAARPEEQQRLVRQAVLIHATDTATSVLLGVKRLVPPRTSVMLALISGVNTALAIAARERT
ncbi:hypothetical protein [Actinoplanes sp. N902-109]|uniref:hypothetical protein n=1 Tax=Actinoplanes sp. (strain N902-109) TaxID=649831 RepID=UPI0003295B34|nr:hypothetical protein [Actinoplanes sp. N902-109]AGL19304.1 hypothetical protein L083_5794 [Actinoplanes sp. N902-109]